MARVAEPTRLLEGLNVSPSINSSRLRRLLGDAAGLGADLPSQDLAQGLGQWLGAYDAMTLHGALQAVQAMAEAPAVQASEPAGLPAWDAEFQRLRKGLTKAITAGDAHAAAAGGWRGASRGGPQPLRALAPDGGPAAAPQAPLVAPSAAGAPAPDYGAFHKRYVDLQRQMEGRVGPFRAQLRQAMARTSTRLQQLAALDAVLEQTLGPREQRLLGAVPVFLERRFEQLRPAPAAAERAAALASDAPAPPADDAGWRLRFEHEFQQVLLAELTARLQPVVGMMEAFGRELAQPLKATLTLSQKKTQ